MQEKEPLEKFLDEVARTLELTEIGKKQLKEASEQGIKKELPPDIYMKLMKAKAAIEIFLKLNAVFVPKTEEGKAEIEKAIEEPYRLTNSGREIIEQSKRLQEKIEAIRNDINVALTLAQADAIDFTMTKPVKQGKEKKIEEDKARRKKFRRIKDTDRKI